MDQFDILDQTIREIKEKEDYSRLEAFRSPRKWEKMRDDQKEAIALLFIRQGSKQLDSGEVGKAFESFSLAERLSPNSSDVFLYQILALTKPKLKSRYHFLAIEKGKKAVQLDPNSFPALARQARTYLELGIHQKEYEYLFEADRLFERASTLRTIENDPEGTMMWMWGTVWHEIGKNSGEAIDFSKALRAYGQAEGEGLSSPHFYNDYGNCLVEMAKLMNQMELFLDAIEKFQAMTVLDPTISHGWINIAFLCEKLLIMTDDINFFDEADYAYAKASEIEDHEGMVWYRWAQLLYFVGCRFHKPDYIKDSVAKFEKAEAKQPNQFNIAAEYAEALALFGSYEEDLNSIHSAQRKIEEVIKKDEKDPIKWYIYGKILLDLAEYFDDENKANLAAEKFLHGLEIDKTNSVLWYGLARSYCFLGIEQNDPSVLEEAIKFFSRAHEFGGEMSGEFWRDWGKTLLKIAEMRKIKKIVKSAMEKYERAIELYGYPGTTELIDPEALYEYALCWNLHGELSQTEKSFFKCIDVLKQLIEIQPQFYLAYYHLAISYSHLGDLTNDIEFYERAMEFYHLYVTFETEDESLWVNWGITYLRMLLLTHDPAHPAYNQKILQEAEEKLQRAVSLGCSFGYYILGCLHSKCRNFQTSIEYLRKAHHFETLPPLSELRHDPWLEDLRQTTEYKDFMQWVEKNQI